MSHHRFNYDVCGFHQMHINARINLCVCVRMCTWIFIQEDENGKKGGGRNEEKHGMHVCIHG